MKIFLTNDDAQHSLDVFDAHDGDAIEMLQVLQPLAPLQSGSYELAEGHRLILAKRAGESLDFVSP
jgi:hypothetical protein